MKTVAFVPIKLNSQRLPNKNILQLAGKPMCWHMVELLQQSSLIDEVFVFCSDETIREYLPENTKVLIRDSRLDGDFIKGYEIYESFIKQVNADIYILAHTTSPFLKLESLNNAIEQVQNNNYDSAFSAKKIQSFTWYNNNTINYTLNDIPRTQDLEPIYVETSAFFAFKEEIWHQQKQRIGSNPYIQVVDNIESIDIDTYEDFKLAEMIAKYAASPENV